MPFLDPKHFRVVAGDDLVASLRAAQAALPIHGCYTDSVSLVKWQQRTASSGILGAEICRSVHGYTVRYDSGLQNFAILCQARTLGGTLEAAEAYCQRWVAADPTRRYAWIRR